MKQLEDRRICVFLTGATTCKHVIVAEDCPCSLLISPGEKCKAFSETADISARLAALFTLPDTQHIRE